MRHFHDPVVIRRAPLTASAYTNRRDWENARTLWSGLASVQPDRAFEVRSPERETAQERLVVYLPWGTPVDSTDRIVWDGRTFEVDGEPMRWQQGSLRHVRIRAWRAMH
ncbi:hypothetical protein AB0I84_07545 [Streptomyces spectabilis]|uniref:phage head completion protein n=1 Tax=Streptomyces spectabilis TaxID=68270 RepID=UPI0033EDE614